jgi:Xaa-Pro aminopeptidase
MSGEHTSHGEGEASIAGRDAAPTPPEPAQTIPGSGPMPPHDHAARRDRVRQDLEGRWLFVSSAVHVRYLSGFTGSAGHVLLGPDPSADRIITDDRYSERVEAETSHLVVELTRRPLDVALAIVAEHADGEPVLAVEADDLTWAAARDAQAAAEEVGIRLVGMSGLVARHRTVKDDAEVARLTRANELTAAALQWLFEEVVAPRRTERDLAVALERRFVDLGADGVAFPSIVASGPNGASPHHAATDRLLEAGDLVTIDCGAIVDGYHADHTRTVALGYLDADRRRIYEVVYAAQVAGREAAVADARAEAVDQAARQVVADAGFGPRFLHGTGHGVGLEIHEAPSVARDATATLPVGTTLTVEPGVYVPGIGGVRIEDSLVIVPNGPARALCDAPRELRIL